MPGFKSPLYWLCNSSTLLRPYGGFLICKMGHRTAAGGSGVSAILTRYREGERRQTMEALMTRNYSAQ